MAAASGVTLSSGNAGCGYSRGYGDVGGCAGVAAVAADTIYGRPCWELASFLSSQTHLYIPQTLFVGGQHIAKAIHNTLTTHTYSCSNNLCGITTICGKMCIRRETRICVRGRAPMSAAGLQPFLRTDKEASNFSAIMLRHR